MPISPSTSGGAGVLRKLPQPLGVTGAVTPGPTAKRLAIVPITPPGPGGFGIAAVLPAARVTAGLTTGSGGVATAPRSQVKPSCGDDRVGVYEAGGDAAGRMSSSLSDLPQPTRSQPP